MSASLGREINLWWQHWRENHLVSLCTWLNATRGIETKLDYQGEVSVAFRREAAMRLLLSEWNTKMHVFVCVRVSFFCCFRLRHSRCLDWSDCSDSGEQSKYRNAAAPFDRLLNGWRNSIRKRIEFGKCGAVPATCSGDVIDACEWHLAQLTLIQITISLASIVWDTHKRGAEPLPESHCKRAAWGNFLPAKYFNSIVLVGHIRGAGEQLHTNQTTYPAMSRKKPSALNVYSRTYASCKRRLARLPKQLERICSPKRVFNRLRQLLLLFTALLMNQCFLLQDIIFTCPVERPLAGGNNGVFCVIYTLKSKFHWKFTKYWLKCCFRESHSSPLLYCFCSFLQVQLRRVSVCKC